MALVRTSKPALAEAVFNVTDGADSLRLECLRLAVSHDGPTATAEGVIATAEAFLAFVRPRAPVVKSADLFPADIPTVSP